MATQSSSRPLRLKCRTDLEAAWHTYQGRESVVIKDPLTLRYFRFEPEEYFIMQELDGQRSAAEIRDEFERRFAPQRLSLGELHQFCGQLHRNGLLISEAADQGRVLLDRKEKNTRKRRQQAWLGFLAARFPGVDPDRFLAWLDRRVGWIFSPLVFALSLLLMMSSLGVLLTHFDVFSSRLPTFQDFFAGRNWLLLAMVLGVTKVLHELGHGLACKRFGAQCHELGFMLLVFTPCLYCNVTDAWMLPSKWRRIAISAAGMYFEIILASLATWVWWYSHPGIVNQLALNVMFVCSVTTLLFNANPLMRFDGYYILSDLIEIPNLRQKSSALLQQTASSWLLGIEGRSDPFLPTRQRWFFVSYSIAAVVYRWLLTVSIFWSLYKVLEPYGFKIIGQILAVSILLIAVVMPALQVKSFFSVPGRWSAVKRVRLAIATSFAVAVLLGILGIPIPHYVNCPCYFQAQGTTSVYVETPGHLSEIYVASGDLVAAGDPLVKLTNPDKTVELVRVEGEAAVARVNFVNVSLASTRDDRFAQELLPAAAQKRAAESRLKLMEQDTERLLIRAPIAGTFIAAPPRKKNPDDEGNLRTWINTAVATENRGAFLETQTLVGQIIPDESRVEAILAIDQADIEFIQPNQTVRIWSRQLPGQCFVAQTAQIAPAKMRAAPRQLAARAGGDLQTTTNRDGEEEPLNATYQVNVPLEGTGATVLTGATGVAKVKVGSTTLGTRLWRLLCLTFRFEL